MHFIMTVFPEPEPPMTRLMCPFENGTHVVEDRPSGKLFDMFPGSRLVRMSEEDVVENEK